MINNKEIANTKGTNILKTLGLRLLKLRKDQNKTLEQVSKDLGISISSLASYETAMRKPDPDKLCMLADYYNVSIDYLLGRTNYANILKQDNILQSNETINLNNAINSLKDMIVKEDIFVSPRISHWVLDSMKVYVGENDFGYVTLNALIKPNKLVKLLLEEQDLEFHPLIEMVSKTVKNTILIAEIDSDSFECDFSAFERSIIYANRICEFYNVVSIVVQIDDDKEKIKTATVRYYKQGTKECIRIDKPTKKLLPPEKYFNIAKNI